MPRSSLALLLGAASLSATAQTASLPTFISGCWQRARADGQFVSFEVWMAPRAARILGFSQTVLSGRTEFEFLRIEQVEPNAVDYVAQPSGRPPTRFRMKDLSATHAEFVNPEHDFPQRIRYTREEDLLNAEISGGNPVRRIEFRFRKVACETLTN